MADIRIEALDASNYLVTVIAQSTTMHTVTVQADYAQKLGEIDNIALLKKSFAFLLAREANTSIMRSFDLSVISRYFAEYESEMRR